jgi:polysaccharide biosynthesis transport protein
MAQNNLNEVADTDLGYGQIFAILLRQRFWFLGVFCLVLALATVRALGQETMYQSSLQLLVEPTYQGKKQRIYGDQEQFKEQLTDSNVEIDNITQLALMQSSKLIQRAVNLLQPKYQDITVEEIRESLKVSAVVSKSERDKVPTKIFEATYSANAAIKTQDVLIAMQKVYQEYNLEQQQQRLAKGLAFIDEQLPKIRQSVTQAEVALEKFRQNQNLIEPETQAKGLIEELNQIAQERRTTQAQYREAEARYKVLQQQVASSPQKAIVASRLSESTRYQNLFNEIQKIELELAKQRLRFTDENPVIQNLLQERQDLLALVEQEGKRTLADNRAQISATKESSLGAGQLGEADVKRASQLLETQTNLLGLSARDRTLAQKEQQLRLTLNQFPSLLAQYNRLQPEIQLRRDTLQQLEKARQELSLEIARGGFDWQVVEEPLLGEPIGLTTKQNILIGAVAGLMLASAAAFIREMFDNSIHSLDQLKQQINLPLLGSPELSKTQKHEPVIKLAFGEPTISPPLKMQVVYQHPSWESLDLVYKNIQLQNSVSTLKALTITSPVADESQSTLALGLAISAARLNQRVLLIDANLRSPRLHEQVNISNDWGLSTLLESDATVPIQKHIPSSDIYIDILPSGPLLTDPVHLLSSQRMKDLMTVFQQHYDLVLLNVAPILGTVDAILTASFCQGVVLVVSIGRVTKSELRETTELLSKSTPLGIVANLIKPKFL